LDIIYQFFLMLILKKTRRPKAAGLSHALGDREERLFMHRS